MAHNWLSPWGPDKEVKMSKSERYGAWIMLLLVFALGVAVGHLF